MKSATEREMEGGRKGDRRAGGGGGDGMVERARETAAVVSQRWHRAHARALRSLSPPSLDKAGDDERSKAHALINLQLAFLFVCCMYSVVALFVDGTLFTDNGIVFFLSFVRPPPLLFLFSFFSPRFSFFLSDPKSIFR
jgi:hypothetical protein